MRVRAIIGYDGSAFYGFAPQPNKVTVVGEFEKVLHKLGIETQAVGAGRTDRGVHATAQIVHFDLPSYWRDLQKLQHELNQKLRFIVVRHIAAVPSTFHARFSAQRRAYRYLMKRAALSVFEQRFVSPYRISEYKAFDQALQLFVGRHDFVLFSKQGSNPASTIRTIYKIKRYVYKEYDVVYIEADAFLRAQVRMMLEAAYGVSQYTYTPEEVQAQLSNRQRTITKPAPAEGLYLCRVFYNSTL